MKPQDFFTRLAGNTGQRVALPKPDGSSSDQWLHVLSVDSDAFRRAELRYRREIALAVSKKVGHEEMATLVGHLRTELLASLVAGWSFDEVLTETTVQELLREAPYIADLVDNTASNRRLFPQAPSVDSTSTPAGSSDCASQ
jgi:hypothetical protein